MSSTIAASVVVVFIFVGPARTPWPQRLGRHACFDLQPPLRTNRAPSLRRARAEPKAAIAAGSTPSLELTCVAFACRTVLYELCWSLGGDSFSSHVGEIVFTGHRPCHFDKLLIYFILATESKFKMKIQTIHSFFSSVPRCKYSIACGVERASVERCCETSNLKFCL